MAWYDIFSSFYDKSLEKIYHDSRVRAAQLLDIQQGQTILDVACGTGANFAHLLAYMDESNQLIGTDFSAGMLKKAKQQIDKNGWQNVQLLEADARTINANSFSAMNQGEALLFDRIICVLGLSVIPDWEEVLNSLIQLLKPGGKLLVADVYADKKTFQSRMVEWMARADLKREIWKPIQAQLNNFEMEDLPAKPGKVGGRMYAAIGTKQV